MLSRIVNTMRLYGNQFRNNRRIKKLRQEINAQRTEKYWRRRARARSRRFKVTKCRFGVSSHFTASLDLSFVILNGMKSLVPGLVGGGLVLAAILLVENQVGRALPFDLGPADDSTAELGVFPRISVPVLAALLGFYLATVGIVLGNAYSDVSATVRALVLGDFKTKMYLRTLAVSIGAGLALVLIEGVDFLSIGYLSLAAYLILACFGGWSFVQLAFGAFDLMNPTLLIVEPIRTIYRMIDRIGSRGVLLDEAVLRKSAQDAHRSLELIAELIKVTNDRKSVDRIQLADKVELLLTVLRDYSRRKHKLAPDSGWFLPQTSYPRWVESNEDEIMIALNTSTPLHPQTEPTTDWLEKRAAELVVAALQACVLIDDVEASLRVMRSAARTARFMASCYRIDDATTFAGIIRDSCHSMASENDAGNAVAPELPFMLTGIFLGWQDAIITWSDEIERVVDETKWDRSTREVQIRGSRRIWDFAQKLLAEIHSEIDVEDRRITPDWYLRSALASESIFALREFATKMPELLSSYLVHPNLGRITPDAQVATGSQALQTLQKAELLSESTSTAIERLTELNRVHDVQPIHEVELITMHIDNTRRLALTQIAESLEQLTPVQAKSAPDYFGEALFTLRHHTEKAIADGDTELVAGIFPFVMQASLKLHDHVFATYQPPTYVRSPADFNPILHLLDISGLALTYEAIRDDNSAEPVRQSWHRLVETTEGQGNLASKILDVLDMAKSGWAHKSWMSSEWDRRLVRRIVDAGYTRPVDFPFGEPRPWNAPLLIKMLDISESLPRLGLDPHVLFAGVVIGPMTSEPEEDLRRRLGLGDYYKAKDRLAARDMSAAVKHDPNGDVDGND